MTEAEYDHLKDVVQADAGLDWYGKLYVTILLGVQFVASSEKTNEPFELWDYDKVRSVYTRGVKGCAA